MIPIILSPPLRCFKHLTYGRRDRDPYPVFADRRRTTPRSLRPNSTLMPGSGRSFDAEKEHGFGCVWEKHLGPGYPYGDPGPLREEDAWAAVGDG
jgi:hypothetical protein